MQGESVRDNRGSDAAAVGAGVAVIVPAAGSGVRMGTIRKPFQELQGRTVLEWALLPFLARADVVEVVVMVAAGAPNLVHADPRVRTATGGTSRFESVANGQEALRSGATLVAVHDAARPFPPASAIDACIRLAARGLGAVAGIPAVDTIKRVDTEEKILDTPPRRALWHAQTPQIFPRALFRQAIAHCRAAALQPTDDASMLEAIGAEVRMVEASPSNFKITHPRDLILARAIAAQEAP